MKRTSLPNNFQNELSPENSLRVTVSYIPGFSSKFFSNSLFDDYLIYFARHLKTIRKRFKKYVTLIQIVNTVVLSHIMGSDFPKTFD